MGINMKHRLSWLDNSKMMAMLLIIIYHVGSFANLGEVGSAIESFNMPLFMILSAWLLVFTVLVLYSTCFGSYRDRLCCVED